VFTLNEEYNKYFSSYNLLMEGRKRRDPRDEIEETFTRYEPKREPDIGQYMNDRPDYVKAAVEFW